MLRTVIYHAPIVSELTGLLSMIFPLSKQLMQGDEFI